MHGVESTVSAGGGSHAIYTQSGSQSTCGPLATVRERIAEALGSTGFVYTVGPLLENFETYLNRKPFEIEVGDLKPGTLPELVDWVASEISGDPDEALQIQANAKPERAVTLLT